MENHTFGGHLQLAERRVDAAAAEGQPALHRTRHAPLRAGTAARGVDRFVAERAQNHKLRGVEGTYNQYDYFEERKTALNRWATDCSAP